jgi:hypothetical protein
MDRVDGTDGREEYHTQLRERFASLEGEPPGFPGPSSCPFASEWVEEVFSEARVVPVQYQGRLRPVRPIHGVEGGLWTLSGYTSQ